MLKKIIALGVALIMCIGLFAGCESSQEKQIREDYLAYMLSQGETEMTLDDVKILNNYGTYNGAVVVRIERGAFEVVTTIQVGGVDFTFSNSNTALVWKDGQFFELANAYDSELLTKSNLEALAKKINK
jgi:hypothetical protein